MSVVSAVVAGQSYVAGCSFRFMICWDSLIVVKESRREELDDRPMMKCGGRKTVRLAIYGRLL